MRKLPDCVARARSGDGARPSALTAR